MHDCPGLLCLPAELRVKIYKHLLLDEVRDPPISSQKRLIGPTYYITRYDIASDLPALRDRLPRLLHFRNAKREFANRRCIYKVRAGRFRNCCVDATYQCSSLSPAVDTAILYVNKQLHDEAADVFYSHYIFDFGTNIEGCLPFLSDLTPQARSCIRRISITKSALPYLKDFDRYEWKDMCTGLRELPNLRYLMLGIIAGRPGPDGWTNLKQLSVHDFLSIQDSEEMQWANELALIKGIESLYVWRQPEHCPVPQSNAMKFYVQFSASIEAGFRQYMTERMVTSA